MREYVDTLVEGDDDIISTRRNLIPTLRYSHLLLSHVSLEVGFLTACW